MPPCRLIPSPVVANQGSCRKGALLGAKYWRGQRIDYGRPRHSGPQGGGGIPSKAIIAVLVVAVLGVGAMWFLGITPAALSQRLGGSGSAEAVSIAKRYATETLQPMAETEVADHVHQMELLASFSNVDFDLKFDWAFGKATCTDGNAEEGECRLFDVPTTVTATECFGQAGKAQFGKMIIHVNTETKTARHSPQGQAEERSARC